MNFTFNQFAAAGKHAISFVAGGVAVAATWGLITSNQSIDLTADVNLIADGTKKVLEGITGILAVLTPIYTAWRAAHNASPISQAKSLVETVPGTTVISSSEIAKSTPEYPTIVSNKDVKVIDKVPTKGL